MRYAGLFSGGKDSTFAVWKAIQEGHKVVRLVTFAPENPDSYMFHHPNVSFTRLQAESMGIPLMQVETRGEKEEELKDLEKALEGLGGEIDGVTAGALASRYQASRVEKIAKKLDLKVFSPAWNMKVEEYWNQLLKAGFRVIITKVACDGLGKEWLGKEVTLDTLEELTRLSGKYRFHLGFEGGEAETFVIDCPLFSKHVSIESSDITWDGEVGVFSIQKASLTNK